MRKKNVCVYRNLCVSVRDNVMCIFLKVEKYKYIFISEWMGWWDVGELYNIFEIGGVVSGRVRV